MNDTAALAPPSRFADYVTLTRLRLNSLTVFAVGAGWWAGIAEGGTAEVVGLAGTVVGAALVAAGSSALNQALEGKFDAAMARTAQRPVATGRMSAREAAWFGAALSVVGVLVLALTTNLLTVVLGLVCLGWYLAIYTPLKRRTSLNTLAGTIPGAIPPVMGVAAATGAITPGAWFLFALVVAWQLPHFLSIAWIYREQYRQAGFVMLPGVEGGHASTARQVMVHTLLVLVISLAATPLDLAGRAYFFAAAAAGVVLLGAAASFALERNDRAARVLLRVSVLHLPVVLTAFALDRIVL
jgi:heme o synthase